MELMSKFTTLDFKEGLDQNISLDMMSKAAEMRGEWLQHVQYATQIQKHTNCSAVNYQGAAANVCVY